MEQEKKPTKQSTTSSKQDFTTVIAVTHRKRKLDPEAKLPKAKKPKVEKSNNSKQQSTNSKQTTTKKKMGQVNEKDGGGFSAEGKRKRILAEELEAQDEEIVLKFSFFLSFFFLKKKITFSKKKNHVKKLNQF